MTPFQKKTKRKFYKEDPERQPGAWATLGYSDQPLSSVTTTEILLFTQKLLKRLKMLFFVFLAQKRVPTKRFQKNLRTGNLLETRQRLTLQGSANSTQPCHAVGVALPSRSQSVTSYYISYRSFCKSTTCYLLSIKKVREEENT